MIPSELSVYISAARSAGQSDEEIYRALRSVGWQQEALNEALGANPYAAAAAESARHGWSIRKTIVVVVFVCAAAGVIAGEYAWRRISGDPLFGVTSLFKSEPLARETADTPQQESPPTAGEQLAENQPPTELAPVREVAAPTSTPLFMWQIDHGGARAYILGSVHVASEYLYPLNPAIERAFDEASSLAVEIDIDEYAGDFEAVALEEGSYQDGSQLPDHVSTTTMAILQTYLDERNIPIQNILGMKPWLVSITLSTLELTRLGYDSQFGIDQHFLNAARAETKPIVSLESFDEHLQAIIGINDHIQEAMLVGELENVDSFEEEFNRLMTMWRYGEIQDFASYVSEDSDDPDDALVREEVLLKRNRRMAERIRELLVRDETSFIVVGAAHLVGEESILDILDNSSDILIQNVRAPWGTSAILP